MTSKAARRPAAATLAPPAARLARASTPASEVADVRPIDLFTKLSRTALLLDALQRECLDPHGLAFAEYSVLRILQAEPKRRLSPSRLAERIVRTTGAVTKLVDRLEGAGLLERLRDENDGRAVHVRLTAAGNRLANAASRSYTAGRERVLAALAADEIQATMTSLDRLIEVLEIDVSDVERRSR
jgi:DNA-binding MarR family transcriptional regulator